MHTRLVENEILINLQRAVRYNRPLSFRQQILKRDCSKYGANETSTAGLDLYDIYEHSTFMSCYLHASPM